jgi:hypothetical protein
VKIAIDEHCRNARTGDDAMNATLELPVDLVEYIKAEAVRNQQTVDALLRDALARESTGEFESAFDNVDAIKRHMSQTYGRQPDSVDSIREDRARRSC